MCVYNPWKEVGNCKHYITKFNIRWLKLNWKIHGWVDPTESILHFIPVKSFKDLVTRQQRTENAIKYINIRINENICEAILQIIGCKRAFHKGWGRAGDFRTALVFLTNTKLNYIITINFYIANKLEQNRSCC